MFLSIPSNVFCHIILERLKHALDRKSRCEHAVFRKDKYCTDHIASLIIIEQFTEWQIPLYMNFINFEKALDSGDRRTQERHLATQGVIMEFHKVYQVDPRAI